MTKPKITREQERVFLEVVDGYGKEEAIIRFLHFKADNSWWKEKLKDINIDLFLQLLVNDYEIKKSPQEKLLELYEHHQKQDSNYSMGYLEGLLDTLYTLGIEVEGIEF